MSTRRALRLALAATALTALPLVTPALADNNGNDNPNAWYQGGWSQNAGGNGANWGGNGGGNGSDWNQGRQAREQDGNGGRESKFGRNRGDGGGDGGRDGGGDGGDD